MRDSLYDWLPVLADGDFGGDLPSDKTADAVADVWEEAVAAPAWKGAPVWLHGDLHPANVVVSGGALCGVIDFGDMCAGDPATDLSAAWLLLPAGARHGSSRPTPTRMTRRSRGPAVGRRCAR